MFAMISSADLVQAIGDLPTGLALFDDRQDLLVGEFAPLHRPSSESEGLILCVADQRGQVKRNMVKGPNAFKADP
jgi:hypothetical protein